MNKLDDLIKEISDFTGKTFGQTKESILAKLDEELVELKEAKDSGKEMCEILEFVDCFHLLLDYASHLGLSSNTLINLTHSKLEVNKSREWNKPNEDGVVKHIEEDKLPDVIVAKNKLSRDENEKALNYLTAMTREGINA